MKNLFSSLIAMAFVATLLSLSGTKTDHVGAWKGEDQSKLNYVHLAANGNAYFINKNDTTGGESFKIHEGTAEMVYEVNYETAPKSLDFIIRMKKSKTEMSRMKSIFEFDKQGRMRLCMHFTGEARPSSFEKDRTLTLSKK